MVADLAGGQDPWRLAAVRVKTMLVCRSLPGARHLGACWLCLPSLDNEVDVIGMVGPKAGGYRTPAMTRLMDMPLVYGARND